jgi:hypothetical protein
MLVWNGFNWRALVNKVTNLRVLYKAMSFLTG